MGNVFYFEWERRLIEWLQAVLGDKAATFLGYVSFFGEELLMVAVIGFFYWGYDKELGSYLGRNLLAGSLWNPMIKNVFLRRRPYLDDTNIKLLRIVDSSAKTTDVAAQGFSFPSAHSTCSAALYGSFPLYKGSTKHRYEKMKKFLLIISIVLPLLVGFSRVIVGAHYPTDVVVGWLLGVIVIFLVPFIYNKINNDWIFAAVMLVVAATGFFYCKSEDYFSCFGLMLGFLTAIPVEKKYVEFENTNKLPHILLRLLGGLLVFVVLNALLKLIFSADFFTTNVWAERFVRTFRYAVITFIDFVFYPMLFKLFKKQRAAESE